jgi:acetylornithine aminotransferase
MMIGIQLDAPCTELVAIALAEGLLINVTGATTIRLLPPLIINKEQIELLVSKLSVLVNCHTQQ